MSPQLAVAAKWLLIAGMAYSIAQTVLFFLADSGTEAGSATQAATPRESTRVNIQAVMQRHLFGIANSEASSEVTQVATVETRLPLELQAVFVATEDAAKSKAIVAEKGSNGQLYRVGSDLPGGARLAEVNADHIVITRGGTRERLTFPRLQGGLASALDSPSDSLPEMEPGMMDDYPLEDPGMEDTGTIDEGMGDPMEGADPAYEETLDGEIPPAEEIEDYQARLQADPVGTLQSLGVEAVATDAAQGYRVGSLAQSPYLRQTGLQPGDVIVSVNGQPVGNVDSDRMELASVLAEGSARIEVQRGSRRFYVTTSLKQ